MNTATSTLSNRIKARNIFWGLHTTVKLPNTYIKHYQSPSTNKSIKPVAELEVSENRPSVVDFPDYDLEFKKVFSELKNPNSAMDFIPALQKISLLKKSEVEKFANLKDRSQVLWENEHVTLRLIYWPPKTNGKIHGHTDGGCIFKVLYGNIEEYRYSSLENPILLASTLYRAGGMAFIHDHIAYHSVNNPEDTAAVSLHFYIKN